MEPITANTTSFPLLVFLAFSAILFNLDKDTGALLILEL